MNNADFNHPPPDCYHKPPVGFSGIHFLSAPGGIHVLVLLFAVFFLFPGNAWAQITCPYTLPSSPTEEDVLKKFYCETDGPNWTNKTNWGSSGALNTWYGVTADHQGKVHALNLDGNMLSGKIPPELGNLTGLGALDLQNNQLTGSIPAELGNLTALLFLRLSNNMLTGSIPPELGMRPDLTVLDLGNNELSGEIPEELGDLTNL
ncbi:MAG: hypothetical protein OXK19_03505 [Candidatus Dadabacteria bacterium]|nr:hypothetical protein [Candidatus Dadabacteria bacterium]